MRKAKRWRGRALSCVAGLAAVVACRARDVGKAPAPAASAAPPPDSAAARSFYADIFSRRATLAEMTSLGRALFFDETLSASGRMSCATCHDPAHAYAPGNALSVQPGGPDGKSVGLRAVPSLRYLQTLPPFSEHHFDEAIEDSTDQGPTGGHTWDGRADSAHDQARAPLTSPFEMANASVAAVVEAIARGAHAAAFRAAFGDDVFADARRGETAVLKCFEAFEQSPKDFYPFMSRYDAYLRGQGTLDAHERRGLALFDDPQKGNCDSCHGSRVRQGAFPVFTDFGYQALGVPRNRALPANADAAFFDMGLCGPQRTDLAKHTEYCGEFRVPTLRNVATRRAFFHNGAFHRLEDVVAFYAERDTKPAKWYPRSNPKAAGRVDAFDDLPPALRKNVDRERPFGGEPGGKPALDASEIADVVAFLKTLTDADLENE